ncbi:putative N-acetylglucosamine-1-phosphotransferase subunit gamma [Hypsibius exemplaris]|uniref:N-acetylglucosamine-1-phosphotransferase subunit gamma n=1 Tax=Hypsibius exemplaris TaxID=2072580 RepID=A0A1W0XCU3_HYPEX|nr:putative N-acetylglucosamine-1-phosphotransferase subunit gamma [Hypsibius exemplaris]
MASLRAAYLCLLIHILKIGLSKSGPSSNGGSLGNGVIKMRIIAEPLTSNLSPGAAAHQTEDDDEEPLALSPRTPPAEFTGPEHFRSLIGTCFTLQKANFQYKLCPFQNITQKETVYSLGRSKFHGILGVWHDWIVQDFRFSGWKMLHGDDCGKKGPRSTKVIFECGNTAVLSDATEPEQCRYEVTLKLPQACFPDSLLVYPTLTAESQREWDYLEGERENGELTTQGYDKRLKELLTSVGLLKKEADLESATKDNGLRDVADDGAERHYAEVPSTRKPGLALQFARLDQCQEAYGNVVEQLHQLEANCHPPPASPDTP